MFQNLGLQSGSFSKLYSSYGEDMSVKAESCRDVSKKLTAAGFGLCDWIYSGFLFRIVVSLQVTIVQKKAI